MWGDMLTMKCRNCPASTKKATSQAHWRNHQLCGTCAHKLHPEKYQPPTTLQTLKQKNRIFGREKWRGRLHG